MNQVEIVCGVSERFRGVIGMLDRWTVCSGPETGPKFCEVGWGYRWDQIVAVGIGVDGSGSGGD